MSVFSRIAAIIMTLIALLSGGRYESAQMTATVPAQSDSGRLEYVVVNRSPFSMTMDEYYTLEKEEDGDWIPVGGEYYVNDIAYIVAPFSELSGSVNLGDYVLETGEYRLTKEYHTAGRCGIVSAVFTVG